MKNKCTVNLPAEDGASLAQYGRCGRNMFGCQNGASICSPEI